MTPPSTAPSGGSTTAGALTSYVVPSDEGPNRKYYAINDTGRALLEDYTKIWRAFSDAVDGLLDLEREAA